MVSSNMFARNSNTVSDSGIDFDEEVSYGSYALIDGKFVLVCDVEGSAICWIAKDEELEPSSSFFFYLIKNSIIGIDN